MTNKNNKKASPKDVFLHLLSIGTLYFSAGAFLVLIFTLINVGFPDPLEQYYNPGSSLRWSISLLLVLFPTYIWSTRKIHQDIIENPHKKNYRIRNWFTYFTMFAAGGLILGDLITLINTFLGGELTTRFILKVLAVLFVSGAIFGYYRYEVKEEIKKLTKYSKKITWIVSLVVGVAVIAGFWTAGSPFEQRLIRFDNQRVNDLNSIQSRVINYWQNKDNLPESLSDLEDDLRGFSVPVDPETNEPYDYKVLGDLTFELCAEFDTNSKDSNQARYSEPYPTIRGESDSWSHTEGENCFERTIDPDFYDDNNSPRL